jgi:hypothetical protein
MNKFFNYKFVLAAIDIIMIVLVIVGVFFKLWHLRYGNELLILAFSGVLILFGITLYDMIVSPIRKKAIWIITLCFAPLLVGLLYTFLRNDMLESKEV